MERKDIYTERVRVDMFGVLYFVYCFYLVFIADETKIILFNYTSKYFFFFL